MGGVSFTQNKAKAKRGIKVKVFIRPLTLLYFWSTKESKKFWSTKNFSQFFVITLTWLSVIGKKIMSL